MESRIGGSDVRQEAESAMATVPGAAPGVGWRHWGLAWRRRQGRKSGNGRRQPRAAGMMVEVASGDAKVGRCGYGCGSVALADAPGTTSNTNERSSSDGDGGAPVTATMVLW
jgi:hypothetical protein